jgi:PKD domain-containing protein
MNKYILSTIIIFASFLVGASSTQAQAIMCPYGYTCVPIAPQVVNCPYGYTCTPIFQSNPGSPSYPGGPVTNNSIRLISPNGGETIQRGTAQTIQWTGPQWVLQGGGSVWLQPSVPPCADLIGPLRCMVKVQPPYLIAQNMNLTSQSFSWIAGTVVSQNGQSQMPPDGQYKIRICGGPDGTLCDTSDGYFTLSGSSTGGGGTQAGPLAVVSPNGGEMWQKGTVQTIRWTAPYYFVPTYADIRLIRYMPPCTSVCTLIAYAPYTIATNLSINQNTYSWTVGDVLQQGTTNQRTVAPDGQYSIQICQPGTSTCVSSSAPFTIYGGTTGNPGNPTSQVPVITGVDAPVRLSVGQVGTWNIRATDPQNGTLSYSVEWGDQQPNPPYYLNSSASPQFVQTTSFTHSYANPGTYQITFTVRNSSGMTAQSRTTVSVGGANCPSGYMCANGNPYITPYI